MAPVSIFWDVSGFGLIFIRVGFIAQGLVDFRIFNLLKGLAHFIAGFFYDFTHLSRYFLAFFYSEIIWNFSVMIYDYIFPYGHIFPDYGVSGDAGIFSYGRVFFDCGHGPYIDVCVYFDVFLNFTVGFNLSVGAYVYPIFDERVFTNADVV